MTDCKHFYTKAINLFTPRAHRRLTQCHAGLVTMLVFTLFQQGCATEPGRWTEEEFNRLLNSVEALESKLQTMTSTEQDLLLLSLAVRSPHQAPHLCKRVNGSTAVEKCKQVVGRPHLQLSEPQINDVDAQRMVNPPVKSHK